MFIHAVSIQKYLKTCHEAQKTTKPESRNTSTAEANKWDPDTRPHTSETYKKILTAGCIQDLSKSNTEKPQSEIRLGITDLCAFNFDIILTFWQPWEVKPGTLWWHCDEIYSCAKWVTSYSFV